VNLRGHLVVIVTIALALGLGNLPLAGPLPYLWPDWVLLTLTYWSLAAPHRYGLGLAFLAGIFQDVATATLLGLHALIYVIAVYVVIEHHLRIRLLHLWGQSLGMLVLGLFSVLLQLWVEGAGMGWMANVWALLPALTTALLWAPIFLLLRGLRQRFKIA
jgi:rod shape-determining protein MreD